MAADIAWPVVKWSTVIVNEHIFYLLTQICNMVYKQINHHDKKWPQQVNIFDPGNSDDISDGRFWWKQARMWSSGVTLICSSECPPNVHHTLQVQVKDPGHNRTFNLSLDVSHCQLTQRLYVNQLAKQGL